MTLTLGLKTWDEGEKWRWMGLSLTIVSKKCNNSK